MLLSSTNLRDTLTVYQPCASAQAVAVFVVTRVRNQAVLRKDTAHSAWIFKSAMFCLDEWITSVCAAHSSIASENKGAVLNTNLYV